MNLYHCVRCSKISCHPCENVDEASKNSLSLNKFSTICTEINGYISNPLFNVIKFAKIKEISRQQLYKFFMRNFGIHPRIVIENIRLERIIDCISENEKLQIAAPKAGFIDENHLLDILNRRYHMKTRAIRKYLNIFGIKEKSKEAFKIQLWLTETY